MRNYTITVAGTQRSGHHAILVWLCNQLPGSTEYHNTCTLPAFEEGQIVRRGHSKDKILIYGTGPTMNVAYSFEDYTFDEMKNIPSSPLMGAARRICVLVIRDAYNMMASSIKSTINGDIHARLTDRVNRWRTHAENITTSDKWEYISYNDWATYKTYRKDICDRLGIKFTDASRNAVSTQGGGSSFDKMKFNGVACNMQVLTRWKHYITDPNFLRYVDTDEIAELNKKLFGFDLEDLRRQI